VRRQAAQRIDAAHHVGVAPEKHGGILRLQRLEPPIGRAPAERAAWVALQLERLGADAGLLQAALETGKAALCDMDGRRMLRARMHRQKAFGRLAPEVDQLPLRGQAARQFLQRDVIDREREQFLVELLGELILVPTPFGGKPGLRNEEQHRFAARGRIFQGMRPALARNNAALGIEIKKDVVLAAPAFADQPIPERDRPVVIPRGMADEQSRHASSPVAGCPSITCKPPRQQCANREDRFGSTGGKADILGRQRWERRAVGKRALPLALQPPHDLVELIEAAIAHVHHAGLATVIDRDLEPECVGDATLERHCIGVLVRT
jgi:hypothetical protein